MSTHVPGFQSFFFRFFASFCIGKTRVDNIKTTLPIIDNPKMIDYSNKFRTIQLVIITALVCVCFSFDHI